LRDTTSNSGRFQLAFDAPTFKEFVIRDRENGIGDVISRGLTDGFLAGVPLGQWYPELHDCLLVAVTEKRTRAEIDGLARTLSSH
jgi:glycine dehydrogenase subunit 1